jgi:hypothetical protein
LSFIDAIKNSALYKFLYMWVFLLPLLLVGLTIFNLEVVYYNLKEDWKNKKKAG